MRAAIPFYAGPLTNELQAELNKYYDPATTGIGRHGDGERKIVVCARVGYTHPLVYQWYQRFKVISVEVKLNLGHGDIYIMSEKATGHDWKKSSIPTLRHCAGANKYIKLPKAHMPASKAKEESSESLSESSSESISRKRDKKAASKKVKSTKKIIIK